MTALRAAAASVDITPPPGGMMDGYGSRLTPSEGVHDPLFARILVLDDADASSAHPDPPRRTEGRAAAIVGCDLLGIHPWMTSELRRLVASSTGIPADSVLLAATHDHAGPVGLRNGMFSRLDEALAEATIAKIAVGVEKAWGLRQPVSLKTGTADVDTIGMNRRDPSGPADAILRVVLFDGEDGPVASLLNFACHATILSGANMLLSAEFPGIACRIVEAATGAPAAYLNGACGDINPMWVRQDFASVERAGQAVGGSAVRLIADLRAAGSGLRVHNIRWDEFPERAVPGRLAEPQLRIARREITLPLREFQSDEHYATQIAAVQAELDSRPAAASAQRAAAANFSSLSAERWSAAWARRGALGGAAHPERPPQRTVEGRTGESGTYRTEIQAISLADGVAVLALPGEFFAETGALIREDAGIEQLLIACYANDYAGYIVPEHAYDEGGYESGVTFFSGEAEAIIRNSSIELLREVCRDGD